MKSSDSWQTALRRTPPEPLRGGGDSMRDPDRRDLWSVLRGRGTPSLRGLLTRVVVGVGLVLGVLSALAIIGVYSSTASYRDDQQAAVTRATTAESILADLLNAETGVSGYTLTGRPNYLVPYVKAEASYPRSIARLQGLVIGSPKLEQSVASIDRAAKLWFSEAATLIDLRKQGNIQGAVDRINQGIDKARLDALRAEQAELRGLVERERETALRRADRRRTLTILALLLGSVLAVLTVLGATRLLWRRVGAPLGSLLQGVRRVAAGRTGEIVPLPEHAAREVDQLVESFNEMQGQVVVQRDAAEASARRTEAARAERRLWRTVEKGLLPENLPAVPGLRLAARYLPMSPGLAIGGDFYDARVLPDGSLVVVVGDVAGHGAEPAARAARMRFGWRALVEVDPDPQRVLGVLNGLVVGPGEREQGIFSTMCHCHVYPDGRAEIALAGHPRPIVMSGDTGALIEVEERGPILGLLDPPSWPVTEVTIPEGGTLVIYTDGLVEARQGDVMFGSSRVIETLAASAHLPLEERMAYLTERARRYDEGNLRDDVSVLAVQRVPRLDG